MIKAFELLILASAQNIVAWIDSEALDRVDQELRDVPWKDTDKKLLFVTYMDAYPPKHAAGERNLRYEMGGIVGKAPHNGIEGVDPLIRIELREVGNNRVHVVGYCHDVPAVLKFMNTLHRRVRSVFVYADEKQLGANNVPPRTTIVNMLLTGSQQVNQTGSVNLAAEGNVEIDGDIMGRDKTQNESDT